MLSGPVELLFFYRKNLLNKNSTKKRTNKINIKINYNIHYLHLS